MKLILTEEVDNLGYKGDLVDVADGYGRNYLIPRGLAIKATPGAMRQAEQMTRARRVRESATLDAALETKAEIERRRLRIEVRVDEGGTLYGSVSAGDVQRILKQRGFDIERRRIDLSPLKRIGEYEVPVRLHPQVVAHVPIEVVDVEGKVLTEGQQAQKTLEERALEAAAQVEAEEAAGETEEASGEAEDDVSQAAATTTPDAPAGGKAGAATEEEPAATD